MTVSKSFRGLVLAGVGGQGLATIGALLGEAAILEGRNVCLSSTYGTEARGTFTKSDILIDDAEIDFIEVVEPDLILCMAQAAWDKYAALLESDEGERTLLLYDSDHVTPSPRCRASKRGVPIARLASEGGFPGAANLLALGAVVGVTGVVRPESVTGALERRASSGAGLRQGSAEAFEAGLRAAKGLEAS